MDELAYFQVEFKKASFRFGMNDLLDNYVEEIPSSAVSWMDVENETMEGFLFS